MKYFKVLLLSISLIFSFTDYFSQYRDAFSEKKKSKKIKKGNKNGLFSSFTAKSPRKERNPFGIVRTPKGLVGLSNDPFSPKGRSRYKPTGIDSDSFSYKQQKRAIKEKYNNEYVRKKSVKSREKRYKLKMSYG